MAKSGGQRRHEPALVRGLRQLGQGLVFGNLATFAVARRHGLRSAIVYLRELAGVYHTRRERFCRGDVTPLLPIRHIADLLGAVEQEELTLLYPIPLPGGISTLELALLAVAARTLQPRRIVEIGTAAGRTTLNLARHAPEAEILTFDLPPEAPSAEVQSGPDYRILGVERPGILFEDQPDTGRIQLILRSSLTYDWSALTGSVDLMFIDGAHDEAAVRHDSETALHCVRPGGAIFWHDYGHVGGVTEALNQLAADYPLAHLADTTLALLIKP